ncbi:MAG: AAA family ATPase [Candidatus Lokiarchaeota archaeon]|nr:AAA family ATPase [Candidatus Lokiarchaeota archaeon]
MSKYKFKHIIGFAGLPGSGKSTAIDAIRSLGRVITMGDVIRNEARLRNVDPTGENLGKIAKELRINNGPEIIAIKCLDLIKEIPESIIFIDGLRSMSEVNFFKQHIQTFPIIAIVMNETERINRMMNRGRSDDTTNIQEIIERDKREIEFGSQEVLDNAEYKIFNDTSIDDLKKKTKKIVLEIIEKNQ